MENNLKEFRKMYKLTQEQLSDILYLASVQSVKNYENGDTPLPIDKAIIISEYAETQKKKKNADYEINEKNFISLDWIYGRSPYLNERDIMSDILFSLSNIFKITSRKTHNGVDNVLLIDSRFRDFLFEIMLLDSSRLDDTSVSNETFNSMRRDIYNKHKNFLREIFNDIPYLANGDLEIHNVESLNNFKEIELLSILGNKGTDLKIKTEFEEVYMKLNDDSDDTVKVMRNKRYE